MSMTFVVERKELERALALHQACVEGEMPESYVVFELTQVGRSLVQCVAAPSGDVILRATVNGGLLEFGCVSRPQDWKLQLSSDGYEAVPR